MRSGRIPRRRARDASAGDARYERRSSSKARRQQHRTDAHQDGLAITQTNATQDEIRAKRLDQLRQVSNTARSPSLQRRTPERQSPDESADVPNRDRAVRDAAANRASRELTASGNNDSSIVAPIEQRMREDQAAIKHAAAKEPRLNVAPVLDAEDRQRHPHNEKCQCHQRREPGQSALRYRREAATKYSEPMTICPTSEAA